jgi:hypothetical protein
VEAVLEEVEMSDMEVGEVGSLRELADLEAEVVVSLRELADLDTVVLAVTGEAVV